MNKGYSFDFMSTPVLTLVKSIFGRFAPTQTPTQKFKIEFSIFTSQEIGSSLVSF